tara:strand:- start:406 stop:717 length:312 start_codon:yes stop_codon:yes gene_type:complete
MPNTTITRTIETINDGGDLFIDGKNSTVTQSNAKTTTNNSSTAEGLDSFSAERVETIEIIEGELISTENEDTTEGTITTKTYADDVIIRKLDGVEVARTIIKK